LKLIASFDTALQTDPTTTTKEVRPEERRGEAEAAEGHVLEGPAEIKRQ
jgi:hypothetical protein